MSNHVSRRHVLAGAAAIALGGSAAVTARPAPAHAAVTLPGGLSFSHDLKIYLVPSGGGDAVSVMSGFNHWWSRDGSRAFATNYNRVGLTGRRHDGTMPLDIIDDGLEMFSGLVCSPDGRLIVHFQKSSAPVLRMRWVSTDGLLLGGDMFPALPGATFSYASFSPSGVLAFSGQIYGQSRGIYTSRFTGAGWSEPELLIPEGKEPAFSPDGTMLAYLAPISTHIDETRIARADGTQVRRLSSVRIESGVWLGEHIYYHGYNVSGRTGIDRVAVATGESEPVCQGDFPRFRPTDQQSTVERLWGNLALDTAIAVSRSRWATLNGPDDGRPRAQAAVISRGDAFYDALAGSALAARKNAPLLITPPAFLYGPAEAEIRRILPIGGLVYVLGGTDVVPQAIEDRLKAMGYETKRLFGEMMYETAIAINNEITTDPDTVFVATGVEFYDALAAGAAAGSGVWGNAVVVLTDGDRMPASSASYLDKLDPARVNIVLAGGPGAEALLNDAWRGGKLPSWPSKVDVVDCNGETAIETALLIAKASFAAPRHVAIATSAGWYDALTGGAMVGSRGGPLLLTPPTGLHAAVAGYLSHASASIGTAYMLGGRAALPLSLESPILDSIGRGGGDYLENTPDSGSSVPWLPNIKSQRKTHTR